MIKSVLPWLNPAGTAKAGEFPPAGMAFQDFDLISQRRQLERQQKTRKRITIAAISSVVVLLFAGAAGGVVLYKNKAPSRRKPVNVAEKAVRTVCASTDYKKTCRDGPLKAVKSKRKSETFPEDILRESFAVVSREIDRVIKRASSGLKFDGPLRKAAFEDCLVLLNDAKEELNNSSISSIKGIDLGKLSSTKHDIKNWPSAVLSYQQRWIDRFPDGKAKTAMRKLLKTIKEHGSNALAIVSGGSSLLRKLKSSNAQRILVALDEAESLAWMNQQDSRRMLKSDAQKFTPNVTVAKDGTGNFTNISAAWCAMLEKYTGR